MSGPVVRAAAGFGRVRTGSGESRERQRVQPVERAWNQYQSGGEPSGDRHDADEQPRRSHTFTNVSSTAAAASKAGRQRDDNEDVAGGQRPAPALDVEGEGERVGGELDRAVRERGASHPRAVRAEAHADHHHVGRDATGKRDLADDSEHPLGAPGVRCAVHEVGHLRHQQRATDGQQRVEVVDEDRGGHGGLGGDAAELEREQTPCRSNRRDVHGKADGEDREGQRARDPRRDPRRGYQRGSRPWGSSLRQHGGRARLA